MTGYPCTSGAALRLAWRNSSKVTMPRFPVAMRDNARVACHCWVPPGPREGPPRREKHMTLIGLIIFLLIGAVAGWLAGVIMKGGGFGLVGNIVVGIIGSLIGGWLFGLLGIGAGGLIGSIIAAVVGAIILLAIIGLIKRA